METPKYVEDVEEIPYDLTRMRLLILNAGLDPMDPEPFSYEEAKKYCDTIVQALIGSAKGEEGSLDIAENTIEYLIGQSNTFPRVYESEIDTVRLLAGERELGAYAVMDVNYLDPKTQP